MLRRRKRTSVFYVFLLPLCFSITVYLIQWLTLTNTFGGIVNFSRSKTNSFETEFHHRILLNSSETNGEYPRNAFTIEQRKDGAVILHIIGMCYMFLALAIACDEFFVPALAIITMKLNISEDVAGATFMAAGGSAPELFTSFIGTFADPESNVGIGTIVGSAVFNVLFVIGMCAVFSKGVLKLTWWPLFRDCIFYSVAVLALLIFFWDSLIQWWESLLLLLAYLLYVTFMKFNRKVESWVRSFLKPNRVRSMRLKVTNETSNPAANNLSDFQLEKAVEHLLLQKAESPCFRYGAIQLLTHTLDPLAESSAAIKVKELHTHRIKHLKSKVAVVTVETEIANNIVSSDTKKRSTVEENNLTNPNVIVKVENDDMKYSSITNGKLKSSSINGERDANFTANSSSFSLVLQNSCDSGMLKEDEITSPYLQQETLASLTLSSDNRYSTAEKESLSSCEEQLQALNENTKTEINSNNNRVCEDYVGVPRVGIVQTNNTDVPTLGNVEDSEKISKLSEISKKSQTFITDGSQQYLVGDDNEEVLDMFNDDEPIDLGWPEGWKNQIFYVIKAPLLFPMYYTCFDVRRENKKSWYPWTFLVSIIWIAGFSYLMVWWAKLVGETVNIPTRVMGLTFLAAGTSIPDLITSVLVARRGFGDMAVSSSIGSNMFDITVGLPLPWIIFSAMFGRAVTVDKDKLFCSVALLFLMLVAVVVCIAVSKWQMSKILGSLMFALYIVFLVITLLIQYDVIKCDIFT